MSEGGTIPILYLPKDMSSYYTLNADLDLTIMNGELILYSGLVKLKVIENYNKGPDYYFLNEEDQQDESREKPDDPDPNYYEYVDSTTTDGPNNIFDYDFMDFDSVLGFLPVSNETIEEVASSGLQDDAVRQLLSTESGQSVTKQRKTITFSGTDAENGLTVQRITVPMSECRNIGNSVNELKYDATKPNAKTYQCQQCDQYFYEFAAFKQHFGSKHRPLRNVKSQDDLQKLEPKVETITKCHQCDKSFKSESKFRVHALGHGDSNRQCHLCQKVLSSKSSLKNHVKTHNRRHPCKYCTKSFNRKNALETHVNRSHNDFVCMKCDKNCVSLDDLEEHMTFHLLESKLDLNDLAVPFEVPNESPSEVEKTDYSFLNNFVDAEGPEEVVTTSVQVKSGEYKFIENYTDFSLIEELTRKPERDTNNKQPRNKVCTVCGKGFDRASDLKRHCIEHILHTTLQQNPVDKDGRFNLPCMVCLKETFHEIDKYKAHLRIHAHLTMYYCHFCDKSFSDSSNFSKHKKVHSKSFQCDLCQRKFNSKKMVARHLEYHEATPPFNCPKCNKIYHFASTFRKHMRFSHASSPTSKYRCRICHKYFLSLKDKWNHEWETHELRKCPIDCTLCDKKFRKFTDLKRHNRSHHGIVISNSKNYLIDSEMTFDTDTALDDI